MNSTNPKEMNRPHKDKSSTFALLFYTVALLIWSIYDLFILDKFGLPLCILLIGSSIFLWTMVYQQQEMLKKYF